MGRLQNLSGKDYNYIVFSIGGGETFCWQEADADMAPVEAHNLSEKAVKVYSSYNTNLVKVDWPLT